MTPQGLAWYVGVPGSGKTTLAARHLFALMASDQKPALVIDPTGDPYFANWPTVRTAAEAVNCLWRKRASCRFEPEAFRAGETEIERGERLTEEMNRVARALVAGGCVHVLFDESHRYFHARMGAFSPLLAILAEYRHADLTVQGTAHHISGQLSQVMLSYSPELFVFRTYAPAGLDALEKDYGVDRDVVRTLPLATAEALEYVHVAPWGEVSVEKEDLTSDPPLA